MKRSVHILKIQIDQCLALICEKLHGLYSPLKFFSKYAVNHKVDAAIKGHLKYFGLYCRVQTTNCIIQGDMENIFIIIIHLFCFWIFMARTKRIYLFMMIFGTLVLLLWRLIYCAARELNCCQGQPENRDNFFFNLR